jgi:hypothetical protein
MKFRKKPVVIEAEQFTHNWQVDDRGNQFVVLHGKSFPVYHDITGNMAVIYIPTIEGTLSAPLGFWVIKGVEGELYPCQPDIFEKTYEKVND